MLLMTSDDLMALLPSNDGAMCRQTYFICERPHTEQLSRVLVASWEVAVWLQHQ